MDRGEVRLLSRWKNARALVVVFGLAVLLGSILLSGVRVAAQAISGVTGVVTDSTGGVVAGVEVRLSNPETGFSATTTTSDIGIYQFSRIPPGTKYILTFSKTNFRALAVSGVTLGVSTTETRDVELQLGEVSQTVEVKAGGEATLNTTDASVGNVLDPKRVQELPSLFRGDAAALLILQPGVVSTGDDSQDGSVTGSRADQGNITLDGLDVNDETIGQAFTTVGRAPIDSIEEVRTITAGSDVSYGRSGGGQIALVTKSGTNDWHGSAHEYHRNTIFAANSFFNNKAGVPRAPLIRNQFGGDIGGPILKNKLFFFFNFEGRRDSLVDSELRTVPLAAFRAGGISYINSNAGCDSSARLNTTPQCITTLSAAQVAALDPKGIGADQALLGFMNGRYPQANDLTAGDGVNTGGFRFTAPAHVRDNTLVGRVDYNLTSKQKLFARGTWDRDKDDDFTNNPIQQFPGDPTPLASIISHERSWVVGHSWTITNNLLNQATFGLTRQVLDFPVNFRPTAPNLFNFAGVSGSFILDMPFGDIRPQSRNVPVPEIRDELSWTRGKHTLQVGTDIKPIRVNSSGTNDINFISLGIGGLIGNLDPTLRPANIFSTPSDATALNEWDGIFPSLLGRFSETVSNYNYNVAGAGLPSYSPSIRDFHYNEYEFYGQDVWHLRSDLTLTYGLRWQYHSVPFEVHGFQSLPSININQLFADRVQAATNGSSGNNAVPLVSYSLGGPVNHAPGYYKPDYRDFSPRLALAYSPSFREGFLGHLLGDRKTSIRAGGTIIYDRILSTLSFETNEVTFLFDRQLTNPFGVRGNPTASLQTDPRFTSINSIPVLPPQGTIPRPNTPNVANGVPFGLANGGFPSFFQLDRNLRTPYAYTYVLGIQRELPGNFLLDVNYVGRLGRKLIAVGDAAQTLNFKDKGSGQFLDAAFAGLQRQVQKGQPITPQAWFENQMNAALAQFGLNCPSAAPFFGLAANNCTELANELAAPFVPVGDLSSTILFLSADGVLNPNVALYAQTGANTYVGNYSSSNYNGLVMSLRKRVSQGLEFDFDYTYSHSIDNLSDITNNFILFESTGQGLICDLQNLRLCRGNSNFDAHHIVSANYVYELPIGQGQRFLHDAPRWLDYIVGGWGTSGIVAWHTGFPFNTHTNTFPINFTQDAPAVYVGPASNIKQGIHTDSGGNLQFFANQTKALNAFAFPFGGGTGNRNVVRGPGFSNFDMALLKNFKMPWSESHRLQLRLEAFNVFNHPSFDPPSAAINNPSSFGIITKTSNQARQLQVALRYDF